jgi:benzoyl-CoA reductase/2-hydroxyglutaryl-CoA dehydratase subunit BcrC/BadD/HgdB
MDGPRRLRTRFDLAGWYRGLAASGRPVAWCSAFAPAEALLALGLAPVYPENHAAMLGALSADGPGGAPYSAAALQAAASAGLDGARLCSYARADLGVLLGAASPIGSLPRPDVFYACDSQCAVVGRWGDAVQAQEQARGRSVPSLLLQAPPLTRSDEHSADELAGFQCQLEAHLDQLSAYFGLRRDARRLAEVVAESDRANRLWQRCLELAARRPAPWTMTDAFQAMAPIVVARGWPACTAFYAELLAELEERLRDHQPAIADERVRLLWDAIPIWPRKSWLARFCAERGAIFAASTYTHSWWFRLDPADAMGSLVRRYAWNTMNRSGRWVLDWTLDLVRDYGCQGIVAHWNRSCGIWNSYVKRRRDGYAAAGVPYLELHADMVDPAAFDEVAVAAALDRFIADCAAAA